MNDIQREIITPARKARDEKSKEQKEKRDFFTDVTICQTVISVLLFFLLLFSSKGTDEMSASLKADYKNLIEWSIENTDAESVMKAVNSFLKEPVNLMPAFSPSEKEESETEAVSEVAATRETTEKETTEEVTEEATTEELTTEKIKAEKKSEKKEAEKEFKKLTVSASASADEPVFPVDSKRITSYFGDRVSPITGEDSFHTGLDIAAPMGTEVVSAYSGKIKKAAEDDRNGKYIIVSHSKTLETAYCHLSEILVKKGDKVSAGEKIGLVGSTGWSTGPHLHFEIKRDGERIDPLSVFRNDV